MESNVQDFIARSLKSLQEQIDYLDNKVLELKARIFYLERESAWNVSMGNLEYAPKDDFIIRLADGRLGIRPPDEREVSDADD